MSCRQGLTNACGIDIELNCGLAPREHVALEIGRDVESKSGHPGVHLGRRNHLRHEQRRIKCTVIRSESGDWSSSTIAIGVLWSVSGSAFAAV